MSNFFDVGDVVIIKDYGNDKFLVCRGWYTHEGSRRSGTYYKRIPDGTIVPGFEVNLEDVVKVTNVPGCPHPPHGGRPHEGHMSGAFVTVDTIEDRNKLVFPQLQHGKIVRVNDVQGEVKYYQWDAEYFTWKDFEFEPSTKVVNKLRDLDIRISNVESNESWKYIADMLGATA